MTDKPVLLTVGHSILPEPEFGRMLRMANVELLVDVRSYPGSQHCPWFSRARMAQWVPQYGVGYMWLGEPLGGRRRASPESRNISLRHPSFRGYADHMQTGIFAAGLDDLLDLAGNQLTAIMCAEGTWWNCHRKMIADWVTLVSGWEVRHLMRDGAVAPHRPMACARVAGAGSRRVLVYDLHGQAAA